MEFQICCASGKIPPWSPLITQHGVGYWTIELTTFDELAEYIECIEQHGQIIIEENWYSTDIPLLITVYDDYME